MKENTTTPAMVIILEGENSLLEHFLLLRSLRSLLVCCGAVVVIALAPNSSIAGDSAHVFSQVNY